MNAASVCILFLPYDQKLLMHTGSEAQAVPHRRTIVRLVVGMALLAVFGSGILLWRSNSSGDWISHRITSIGGSVSYNSGRINHIEIFNTKVPADVVAAIKSISSLEELWLIRTDFTDDELKHLKGLTRLKSLYLGDARVTDAGVEHLKNLPSLRILELNDTEVTDSGLASLRKMPSLVWINLNHTQVTDAGVAHLSDLTRLRRLYLRHTNVTDAALPHLTKLKCLELLTLGETEFSAEGRAMLRKALPNCQIDPNP